MKSGIAGSKAVVALLAGAWLMVTAVVDVATPDSVRLAVLYAIAPLIAAAALRAETTAVYAAAAVVLAFASGFWNDSTGTAQEVVRLLDVALIGTAAVIVAAVRERQIARNARLTAVAETAQRAILPTLPARTALVAAAARYEAAGSDMLVGGDLYDSYHCAAFSRYVVGDVRGKGIAAVEQAARVIRSFRQSAAAAASLRAVASEMSEYLRPFLADEEFVTALLAEVRPGGMLRVVGCGHPPPLLVTPSGAALVDVPAGLPLGWGEEYQSVEVVWRRGDRLLLYTDGLAEARNAVGEFLPVPDLSGRLRGGNVDEALDAALEAVHAHLPRGQALTDDLAVLLLENAADQPRQVTGTGRQEPAGAADVLSLPATTASPSPRTSAAAVGKRGARTGTPS